MQKTLVTILLLIFTIPASAEPFFVQSGEHTNFTRLVTRVPSKDGWAVKQVGRTVILTMPAHRDGFDVNRIFELIPRDRIVRVDAGKGSLTLHLGCECTISAFSVDDNYVALDIISAQTTLRPKLLGKSRSPHPPEILKKIKSPRLEIKAQERIATLNTELVAMKEAQIDISQELSRAITRGLLNPDTPKPPSRRAQVELSISEGNTTFAPISGDIDTRSANVRVTSSMDIREHSDSSKQTLSAQGVWCPPDAATNIVDWGDDRDFDIQISEARQGLFGEFDILDESTALQLSKRYLYFGFGAESQQILALVSDQNEERRLLMEMAFILDGGNFESSDVFKSLSDCSGSISLWAYLSQPEIQKGGSTEPSELLLALSNLPPHLRQNLAPILSERFLRNNDAVNAATALRSVARLSGIRPPAEAYAQADIDIHSGMAHDATRNLNKVVNANVPQSPAALIILVRAKMDSQQDIELSTVGLLETYAQEFEDSELGQELHDTYILALAHTNKFSKAFEELETLSALDTPEAHGKILSTVTLKFAKNAADITFLNEIFKQSGQNLDLLDRNTKLALAARLQELGFYSASRDLVDKIPNRPINIERQLLAAQISLDIYQPFQAEANLLGLFGSAADLLRAEAKSMAGAHEEAHNIYLKSDQNFTAARSAWLAENWGELVPRDGSPAGEIVALKNRDDVKLSAQNGILGRNLILLEDAVNARKTIGEFLDASDIFTARQ